MPASECGIVHRRFAVFGGETFDQRRVRAKLFTASMKLPRMAEDDLGATGEGMDDAANLNVLLAVLVEFADILAVGIHAHHCEAALFVGCFRTADIEEACAVGQFY